jgi:hypothetical protein
MDLTKLLPQQQLIAQTANFVIKTRYGFGDAKVLAPIDGAVPWRPSLLWKASTEFIGCDASDRPFPQSIKGIFSDVAATGLPIRVIVAYPKDNILSAKDYQEDLAQAKKLGVGYLSVADTNDGQLEYEGIPISLHLPPPDLRKYRRCLAKGINDAYSLYMNGNPPHGVQELGQIVEEYMNSLATQAKAKGKLTKSKYRPGKYYKFAKLVEDLINDKTINMGILGKSRGFVDDRNRSSHKPKTRKEAVDAYRKTKNCFLLGLELLEELPENIEAKGYRFRLL